MSSVRSREVEHVSRGRSVRASQDRPEAGQELLERERLHEIVVRAGVEAGHTVCHRLAGGEHENGQARALVPEAAAHLDPVEDWHRDVEHDRVGARSRDVREPVGAVLREIDLVALERQRAAQRLAHGTIVVHHEQARGHAERIAGAAEKTLRGAVPERLDRLLEPRRELGGGRLRRFLAIHAQRLADDDTNLRQPDAMRPRLERQMRADEGNGDERRAGGEREPRRAALVAALLVRQRRPLRKDPDDGALLEQLHRCGDRSARVRTSLDGERAGAFEDLLDDRALGGAPPSP